MFETDENGDLIYIDNNTPASDQDEMENFSGSENDNSDAGDFFDAVSDPDSLFTVPAESEEEFSEEFPEASSEESSVEESADSSASEENTGEETAPEPETPVPSPSPSPEGLDPGASPSPLPDGLDPSLSPSPAPAQIVNPMINLEPEELSVTTSGDIYIYPDVPEEEMPAEARAVTSATVTGLPNSSSLQYLEDVMRGYPSHYKYMAFKSDANYSQSMVLYVGAAGEKNPAQNRIDLTDVDQIEVQYTRSGSTYYYSYYKTHFDSYQISYDSDVFLYTNVVEGYAQFDLPKSFPVSGYIFLALCVAVLALIFRK